MLKLASTDELVSQVLKIIGETPTVTEKGDHHIFHAFERDVLVAHDDRGDWLCKDVTKPHLHSNDHQLHNNFVVTVATMLRGEQVCADCPTEPTRK